MSDPASVASHLEDMERLVEQYNKLGETMGVMFKAGADVEYIKEQGTEESRMLINAESRAEKERQEAIEDILSGRKKPPVTYEDPDQSPLKGFEAQVLRYKWCYSLDYRVEVPVIKHLSDWLVNIYLGNYDYFSKQLEGLSDAEVKKKLNMRETLCHVGAIFHVIKGARALYPGSPIMPAIRRRYSNRIGMEHGRILQRLLELGAEVNVHDMAGYTPLHHCLTTQGNRTTFGFAKLLLRHGADPNRVNRFGCTPLFECLMAYNAEFVELLVKHGARSDVKCNDGVMASQMVNKFTVMQKLLKKGEKKEVRSKRKTAKQDEGFKTCGICKKEGSKKCTGCYIEWYCSAECQRADWKDHKAKCQAQRAEYLPVTLRLVEGKNKPMSVINHQTGKIFPTSNQPASSSAYSVVKVQISFDQRGSPVAGREMLIYNKDRSVCGFCKPNTTEAEKIYHVVATEGFNKNKGFFNSIKIKDQLLINPTILPPETW